MMNVNDIYTSISNFWQQISPLIYGHIVFLLSIRYIAGIRLGLRDRLDEWTATAEYQTTKKLLTEFELWKKLPFLLIAAALVYFTLLQDGLSILGNVGVPPLRIAYSEEQFWIEAKPVYLIENVLQFAPRDRTRYWQLIALKEQLLDEYKTKAADRYQRLVGWHGSEFAKHSNALRIGVAFFFASLAVIVWHWRTKRKAGVRHQVAISRAILLLLLVIVYCSYERMRVEQAVEYQLESELLFVGDQLQFDEARAKLRMTPAEFWVARRELVSDLLAVDEARRLDIPWLSRALERLPWIGKLILQRKFAYISKPDFQQKYAYVFDPPPPELK
jgi:hypothetical protein